MENQSTATQPQVPSHVPPQVPLSHVSQKRKSIVSPISPLSSYKSIIIVLCAAILFWMLLQGGNKREIKDIFRKRHETTTTDKYQSTIDNTKDTIKNSYEKAAESTKTTFQNVADKMKNIGGNVKSMYDDKMNRMQETTEENKEYLKDKVYEAAETTKGTLDSLKGKSQSAYEDVKQTTKGTLDSLKEKSQDAYEDVKQTTKETLDSLKEKSQGAYENIKASSQGAYENIKASSQGAYENIKTTSQETLDRAKEKLEETQNNILHRLDMVGLVEQAYLTLEEFFGPHLKAEEQIPFKAFSGAKAVVFLTVVKGGIGLSGAFGSGIIIVRNEIGHWSGPCSIALIGVDVGLNIGVEKSNHIIILRDDAAIRAFSGKGQFKLGIDASVAIGPRGHDLSAGFSVGDKGYASMFSYSLAKGAYIGLSFEGQMITVRNDCNEQYYGTKVDASKILDGTIKPPKNKRLNKIYKFIDDYAARNLVYPEHSTDL